MKISIRSFSIFFSLISMAWSIEASADDICADLSQAVELSSTCVPGATSVCTLQPGSTSTQVYKVTQNTGSLQQPLPPIVIGDKTALCIADTTLSGLTDIYAQSFWVNGGVFKIGSTTAPISASNKVTIYMTGSSSAAHPPQPICVTDQSHCSANATEAIETPNARDITVTGAGQLLMYGSKGSTALASGTVGTVPDAGDLNTSKEFNTLSGNQSWTYLSVPAGPAHFSSDLNVQAPVDYSSLGQLKDPSGASGTAPPAPAKEDWPYLAVLANSVTGNASTEWQTGDWVSISTTTFSPHETEIVQICDIFEVANTDPGLPSALQSDYGKITGPDALPSVSVLVLAGAPSYKASYCNDLENDTPLRFYHFGSLSPTPGYHATASSPAAKGDAYAMFDGQNRNFGVDERAEVALLSRNIKLTSVNPATETENGIAPQYFGGHIAIMNHGTAASATGHAAHEHGSGGATGPSERLELVGVEIERFGQPLVGRYPVHLHRLNSASDVPDERNLLVQDSSVHHSFNKCFVIHDTMASRFLNNSCVRFVGQGVYLEDGYNIFGNQIIRNLVAGATAANMQYGPPGAAIIDAGGAPIGKSTYWQGDYLVHSAGLDYDPSNIPDASNSGANTGAYLDTTAPGGFWITTFGGTVAGADSPNVIANNSVAGCPLLGSAYWFVRQNVQSFSERNTMDRPDQYPVFTGNRGHGCYNGVVAGLVFADGFPTIGVIPAPTPPIGTNGLSQTEQTPVVVFDGLTMTQIENKAFWYRGAFVAINNGRFSALKNGMTLLGGGGPEGNLLGFWGMVRNSSFAGVTNNNVGRYSDCEGYYEKYSEATDKPTATTALPLELRNEQSKCADLTLNSRVTTVALPQLFGVIRPDFNFQGYTFYDGPARLHKNRFINFRADPTSGYAYDNSNNTYASQPSRYMTTLIDAHRMMNYKNAAQLEAPLLGGDKHYGSQGDAAFSWLPANKQSVPPTQYALENRWENVNFQHQIFSPISNLNPIQDGDKQAVQIDRDATLSGYVVCAQSAGDRCKANQNPNHYPISLSNISYYQTPYTTDEPNSRGRNNAISSALMSPHKYATLNVTGTSPDSGLAPLKITRDLAAPSGAAAETTMDGRGGNPGVVETTVMNNMGYSLTAAGDYMSSTEVDLMLSFSDAPQDTNFINRIGICIGKDAHNIKVNKTAIQWPSAQNYLEVSKYYSDGVTNTKASCPDVFSGGPSAFSDCTSSGAAVPNYDKKSEKKARAALNTNFEAVTEANLSGTSPDAFTEGYYHDSKSGMLYLNMYQAKAPAASKIITPPYGTCNTTDFVDRRNDIIGALKYSDPDDLESLLNTACYAGDGAMPQRSELLSCPDAGCSLYTVSIKRTSSDVPDCKTPSWAKISSGSTQASNTTEPGITYAAPYQLYDKTSGNVVDPTNYSVSVPASEDGTMDGLYDTALTPAKPPSALLPLQDLHLSSPPTISLTVAPASVTISKYAQLWTLVTGTGEAEVAKATLTPTDGGVLLDSQGSPTASISIGSNASPARDSATFYLLGQSATLSSGGSGCTVDFDGGTATGEACSCLTVGANQTLIVAAKTTC